MRQSKSYLTSVISETISLLLVLFLASSNQAIAGISSRAIFDDSKRILTGFATLDNASCKAHTDQISESAQAMKKIFKKRSESGSADSETEKELRRCLDATLINSLQVLRRAEYFDSYRPSEKAVELARAIIQRHGGEAAAPASGNGKRQRIEN